MAADQAKATVNKYLTNLDEVLRKNEKVQKIEASTKIRPSFLSIGVSVFLLLVVLFTFGGDALSNLLSFAYPMFETSRTLRTFKQQDVAQWLTYWQIVALLELFESFLEAVVERIPGYYLLKIGFLVWAFLPETRGASVIYNKVLDPFLNKHHGPASPNGAAAAAHEGEKAHEAHTEHEAHEEHEADHEHDH